MFRKLWGLKKTFSKVAGYNTNIKKSAASFCATTVLWPMRLIWAAVITDWKVSSSPLCRQWTCWGRNWENNAISKAFKNTQEKHWRRKLKQDTSRWKDLPCLPSSRILYYENGFIARSNLQLDAIPMKSPMTFFTGIQKAIIKSTWKQRRPRIAKSIQNKMNNAGDITMPGKS